MAVGAEQLARKQKQISISEFFEKNKHILGFDSDQKALLTSVKEAVDNSLDACEEAHILPEISVRLEKVEGETDEYVLTVDDNGPGIVRRNIANVFGKLLYGSRFHAIRQSRGQQGIGISAVVMYGQLTTGKKARVKTKVKGRQAATSLLLYMNTKTNSSEVSRERQVDWDIEHGTSISVNLRGKYVRGPRSIIEYMRGTAIVNPHAHLVLLEPDGNVEDFTRAAPTLPRPTVEIKPHPKGLELGTFIALAKESEHKRLQTFMRSTFESVSYAVAKEIAAQAGINPLVNPKDLTLPEVKALLAAVDHVKIKAPSSECLSPIGSLLIKKGLRNVLEGQVPKFYADPVTRKARVYAGNPFLIETGIVYGGDLPKDKQVTILRFANRVPLLYQQGACAITQAIEKVDWRRYGLEQRGGKGLPYGPAIIMVHVASTQVPFNSQAKLSVSSVDEIEEEIINALRGVGRQLKIHMARQTRRKKSAEKFDVVATLLPLIAKEASAILAKPVPDLRRSISQIMNVVWIDTEVTTNRFENTCTIRVHNYTDTPQSLAIHALVPEREITAVTDDPPLQVHNPTKIHWRIRDLAPVEVLELSFKFSAKEKGLFSADQVYLSDIHPNGVIGAEPLPGDWYLDDVDIEDFDELEKAEAQERKKSGTLMDWTDPGDQDDDDGDDDDEGEQDDPDLEDM